MAEKFPYPASPCEYAQIQETGFGKSHVLEKMTARQGRDLQCSSPPFEHHFTLLLDVRLSKLANYLQIRDLVRLIIASSADSEANCTQCKAYRRVFPFFVSTMTSTVILKHCPPPVIIRSREIPRLLLHRLWTTTTLVI